MARKGTVLWELKREELMNREEEAYYGITRYALRSDGVLLTKYATRNLDGSARYDYGWTVKTRKPKANTRDILLAAKFH